MVKAWRGDKKNNKKKIEDNRKKIEDDKKRRGDSSSKKDNLDVNK